GFHLAGDGHHRAANHFSRESVNCGRCFTDRFRFHIQFLHPSFPRKRESRFFCNYTISSHKSFHSGFFSSTNSTFPCSIPFLQLLLSRDRKQHVRVRFIINDSMNSVLLCEPFNRSFLCSQARLAKSPVTPR